MCLYIFELRFHSIQNLYFIVLHCRRRSSRDNQNNTNLNINWWLDTEISLFIYSNHEIMCYGHGQTYIYYSLVRLLYIERAYTNLKSVYKILISLDFKQKLYSRKSQNCNLILFKHPCILLMLTRLGQFQNSTVGFVYSNSNTVISSLHFTYGD